MSEENIEALLAQVARVKVDKLLLQGVALSKDSALLLTDSLSSLPANFSSITHVDVSNTGIDAEGFHALCDAIGALPDMQVLIAKDNELPKEAGLAVARVLRAGQGLTELDLSNNALTDVGVAGICGAILADETDQAGSLATASNESIAQPLPFRLRSLGLANNHITENGLQKLCHALGELIKMQQDVQTGEYVLSLTELQLGSNRLGDEGARILARFLNMHMDVMKLEQLGLGNCGMTARGLALLLSAVATSCRSLTNLNIKGNGPVNVHVLHALTRVLLELPNLTAVQVQLSKQNTLDLLVDKDGVSAMQQLAEAVKHHNNLQQVDFGDMEQTVDTVLKGPGSGVRSVSFGATKNVHAVLSALKTIRRATQHRRNIANAADSHYNPPDVSTTPSRTPRTPSPTSSPSHSRHALVQSTSTAEFSRARDEQRKAFRTLSEEVMKLIPALEQLTTEIDRPVSSTHSIASNDLDYPYNEAADLDEIDNAPGTATGSRYSVTSNLTDRPNPSGILSGAQDQNVFAQELAMLAAKQALELYRKQGDVGEHFHPAMEQNSENIDRLSSKVASLSAQIEVIQERLADFDTWIQKSSGEVLDELVTRVAVCEQKIEALEVARVAEDSTTTQTRGQLDLRQVDEELTAAVAQKTQPMLDKLDHLTKRLLTLEQAVESEHETSLHVLTTILNQRKRNLPTGYQDSDAFLRSSENLHQHISSMLNAAQTNHNAATPLVARQNILFTHPNSPPSGAASTINTNADQH